MASSLLGTFSDTLVGIVGSILFGLAHGFVSPGLFILVGAILYDRCGQELLIIIEVYLIYYLFLLYYSYCLFLEIWVFL